MELDWWQDRWSKQADAIEDFMEVSTGKFRANDVSFAVNTSTSRLRHATYFR